MPRFFKIFSAVAVLLLAAGAIAWLRFDAASLKSRIVEAVARATGRTLAIDGRLSLQLLPSPAVTATGVTLSNRLGGSNRPMAIVQSIEAHIAWAPLLSGRLDVDSITLLQPDLLLETDADGIGNWQFTRPPSAPTAAAPTPSGPRLQTEIDRVTIQGGHLLWRDGRTHHQLVLDIPSLTAEAASPDAQIHLTGTLQAQATPIQFTATAGPLAGLTAGTPWPLDISLAAVGGTATAKGTLTDPLRGRGYDAVITATLPALDALNAIFPHANLPPLRDVGLTAHLKDVGAKLPAISEATLKAGASDLAALRPGLSLTSLALSLPAPDQPIAVTAAGRQTAWPVTVQGQIGPAAALAANQPVALKLAATIGGVAIELNGNLADPSHQGGLDAQLGVTEPQLGPAAQISLAGRLVTTGRSQIALHGLTLRGPSGDLTGDLALALIGRPKLTGTLASQRLDLDALATRPLPLPAATSPAPPPAATPALAPPPVPPLPQLPQLPPTRGGLVIPDTPLPSASRSPVDADLQITAQHVTWRHTALDTIATHLVLSDGHVSLDPFAVHLEGGSLTGALHDDAPNATASLQARNLPAAALFALAGQPATLTGILDGHADLKGSGTTPRALAASLDGRVGLTLVNGAVEAGRLADLLAPVLASAGAPPGLAGQATRGHADLRCLAVAATLAHGDATLTTLMLDSAALDVSGTGTVQLGPETFDLRLRPLVRLGGTGVAVPLRVTGPWRAPKATWDGPAEHGKASFSAVIGALTKADPDDECGPALAAARDGQPGAAPAAAAKPKPPNLGDLLRGLTR